MTHSTSLTFTTPDGKTQTGTFTFDDAAPNVLSCVGSDGTTQSLSLTYEPDNGGATALAAAIDANALTVSFGTNSAGGSIVLFGSNGTQIANADVPNADPNQQGPQGNQGPQGPQTATVQVVSASVSVENGFLVTRIPLA